MKEKFIKYPVISFFSLTSLISWPLFIIVMFIFPGNMLVEGVFGSIATFGPALSGVIVSTVTNKKRKEKQGNIRIIAFIISWLFSALIMILYIIKVRNNNLHTGLIVFSGLLSLLPAYIISKAFSDKPKVRDYLETLIKPKGKFYWYLIALFTFPLFQYAGYIISIIMGNDPDSFIHYEWSSGIVLTILLTFLFGFLFSGGINEETGWRGFAIPEIQKRFSPLIATIIVWFFWALWHLLYDIHTAESVSSVLLNRLVYNLFWSVLFVWIFNRTKKSILAPAIFHPAMNTSSEFFVVTDHTGILFGILTIVVIFTDKMWKITNKHGNNGEKINR